MEPERYHDWYRSARGRWMAEREFALLQSLLPVTQEDTVLDVGCGTGQFSRCYHLLGAHVTGLDLQLARLCYARARQPGSIRWVAGSAVCLPFANESFDVAVAVTSLCFVPSPAQGLAEMWRISRRGVIVAVLNRHSLLYWRKRYSPGYQGARWDVLSEVLAWGGELAGVAEVRAATALLTAEAGLVSRGLEKLLPKGRWGGFLAVCWEKA